MTEQAERIVESRLFRGFIIAVILSAGVLAGVETNSLLVAQHGSLLKLLDITVLSVFVAEIVLKLVARGRRPLDYFRDGWNIFDFTIVVFCLLPIGGPFAAVLRLARTLRLLRLVTALPKLQLLVGALIKSLSSMGYVALLLGLIFYIYAITGIHLFRSHAPEHFGSLRSALLALFQMITLDNWRDLYESARSAAPLAATVYFVSFILLGTMIMLNLFIGIVMNSMAEMHRELDDEKAVRTSTDDQEPVKQDGVKTLETQLQQLQQMLDSLRATLSGPTKS